MKRPIGFFDVDTQFDFMSARGALYVPGAEDLVERLETLLKAARDRGIPVVASADAHVPDDPEFAIFPPHCVKGTPGAAKIGATRSLRPLTIEVDGEFDLRQLTTLGSAGRDVLIEKRTFDVFTNPNAEKALARMAIPHWVVFGVATDYCVRAAALGLLERGYQVTLVTDAIAAVDIKPGDGERALAEMQAAGARFVTTDAVLAMVAQEDRHVA